MKIAIPLFDRFTALDAVGPFEVLWRLPGAEVVFVASDIGPVRSEDGMLAITADARLSDVRDPDIIVVPGGRGTRTLVNDPEMTDWIRHAHEHSQWTTSVCTGSLLLAAVGALEGLEATTHWLQFETLAGFGARPVERRVVEQGKVMTAAGVSAGIDMALMLAARIAGDEVAQAIQLSIEYDPEPPFSSGSRRSAPDRIVELVRSATSEFEQS
jgi:putative intracellular protease/amidase